LSLNTIQVFDLEALPVEEAKNFATR
jgi:hypothetical protein